MSNKVLETLQKETEKFINEERKRNQKATDNERKKYEKLLKEERSKNEKLLKEERKKHEKEILNLKKEREKEKDKERKERQKEEDKYKKEIEKLLSRGKIQQREKRKAAKVLEKEDWDKEYDFQPRVLRQAHNGGLVDHIIENKEPKKLELDTFFAKCKPAAFKLMENTPMKVGFKIHCTYQKAVGDSIEIDKGGPKGGETIMVRAQNEREEVWERACNDMRKIVYHKAMEDSGWSLRSIEALHVAVYNIE